MASDTQIAQDWHPADIGAALKKNGWTFASLARYHGYAHRQTLQRVKATKWPKGEAIIAEAIGVKPEVIWPSRYLDKYKRVVTPRNVNRRAVA
ncbi:MAG: helix-turn-helix domain-containing protein [Halothiobacillus sp.]